MIQTPRRTRSPARASRCRASVGAVAVHARRGPRAAGRPGRAAAAISASVSCGLSSSSRTSSSPTTGASRPSSRRAWLVLRVEREAHAEPELGVVLEQRVVPRRPAALGVRRPRRGRQVGAVDRRAAGGVGHDHAVAEQLGDELEVRRLAAARAGAARTRTAARAPAAPLTVSCGRSVRSSGGIDWKKSQRGALDVAMLRRRLHVDRLVADLGLALGRADVDADAAAGAVVGRDLDREPVVDAGPAT